MYPEENFPATVEGVTEFLNRSSTSSYTRRHIESLLDNFKRGHCTSNHFEDLFLHYRCKTLTRNDRAVRVPTVANDPKFSKITVATDILYSEYNWPSVLVDPSNPLQWTYFPTRKAAIEGKRVSSKPGRIVTRLKEHFEERLGGGHYLFREQSRFPAFAAAVANAWNLRNAPAEICIAEGEEEINRVYMKGPSSCMSYSPDKYNGSAYPVSVYDSPDVELLYAKRGNNIVGRTLLNKTFDPPRHTRIYGNAEAFSQYFKERGIPEGSVRDLTGCRLKKKPCGDALVAPYLDGNQAVREFDDDYVIVGGGPAKWHFNNTSGLSTVVRTCRCELCTIEVERGSRTNTLLGTRRWLNICRRCVEDRAVLCYAGLWSRSYVIKGSSNLYRLGRHLYTRKGLAQNGLSVDEVTLEFSKERVRLDTLIDQYRREGFVT